MHMNGSCGIDKPECTGALKATVDNGKIEVVNIIAQAEHPSCVTPSPSEENDDDTVGKLFHSMINGHCSYT